MDFQETSAVTLDPRSAPGQPPVIQPAVPAETGLPLIDSKGRRHFLVAPDLPDMPLTWAATAMQAVESGKAISSAQPVPSAGALRYFGFNYASWWDGTFASEASFRALGEMAATGANLATIIPTRYLDDGADSRFHRTQSSESDANVMKAIRDARSLGLSVMLKPHIDVLDGAFRGSIDAADVEQWFAAYTELMLDYARLAEREGVELLCIGTELTTMTRPQHLASWRRLIAEIRRVFTGKLTYAANWGEEKNIEFWNDLDYIGVDFYAPLTESPNPGFDQLVDAWTGAPQHKFTRQLYGGLSIMGYHRALTERWGRPLIFTEIGFRSIDGANIQFSNTAAVRSIDLKEQAELYRSFIEAVRRENGTGWLQGVSLWNWEPADHETAGAEGWLDFTPQGKPAQEVLEHWFRELRAGPGLPTVPAAPANPESWEANGTPLRATFLLQQDWLSGFWGKVVVRNAGTELLKDWRLMLTLPGDVEIKSMWGIMEIGRDGRTLTLAPAEAWSKELAPGASTTVGLTFDKTYGASRKLALRVLSANGATADQR